MGEAAPTQAAAGPSWRAAIFALPGLGILGLAVAHCRGALWRGPLSVPSELAIQKCIVERDVEFSFSNTSSGHLVKAPGFDGCCMLCQEQRWCRGWTWLPAKAAGAPGRCWLADQRPRGRAPRRGSAAGLPSPRGLDAVALEGLALPPRGATLFCFSVMAPAGHEHDLVVWQLRHGVSIFACEEHAVFSNSSVQIGPGVRAHVVNHQLRCRPNAGADWAFNGWMFIEIWRGVILHGMWQYHDWTVKVDPDAVFFPDRLRYLLREHQGDTCLINCKVGVHPPTQAVRRNAMAVLAEDYASSWDGKSPKTCMMRLQPIEYGNCTRDTFLDACLSKVLLSKPTLVNQRLSCHSACNCKEWSQCNTDYASFHPHRTVESYEGCMLNSLAVTGRRL